MRISIGHTSRYSYATPTRYSILALRLTPPSFDGQSVIEWQVKAPGMEAAQTFRDGFGNSVHLVTSSDEHSQTEIVAKGIVQTADRAGIVSGLVEPAPARVYRRFTPLTQPDDGIRRLSAALNGGADVSDFHELMHAVRDAVDYKPGETTPRTTAAEALKLGRGVCQDHAHVFIAASRAAGVPARYVSGYLLDGTGATTEANHAWAEVNITGLGWVGFDVTNCICPTDRYVRLATGLDTASSAAILGSRRGGAHESLDVIVEVQQQSVQQQ